MKFNSTFSKVPGMECWFANQRIEIFPGASTPRLRESLVCTPPNAAGTREMTP